MKKFLFSFIAIAVLLIAALEILFSIKKFSKYNFGPKVYIHRCGYPENTIDGAKTAIDKGYFGLECDIFYDAQEGQFIVHHDVGVSGPSLEELLESLPTESIYLWLDYKNASIANGTQPLIRLKNILKKYKIEKRSFVESTDGWHQVVASYLGLNTSMWLRAFNKSRLKWFRRYLDRIYVSIGNHVAVSTSSDEYQELSLPYQRFPKLVFTVNQAEDQELFFRDSTVQVVLKDLEPTGSSQ